MYKKAKISAIKKPFIIPHFLSLGQGVSLCGGAIRAWINGEHIDDYDVFVFCKDEIKDGKPSEEMEAEAKRLSLFGFKKRFICPEGKMITLKNRGVKVQIIRTEEREVSGIIDHFDFTCCQFGTDGESIFSTLDAVRDTKRKLIRIHKLEYPAASIGRLIKYKGKGYVCDQHTKMGFVEKSQLSKDTKDLKIVYID